MAEELGRIERPSVEEFRKGRKLFLVPLIFHAHDPDPEYLEKYQSYWSQVENQLSDLEVKLGKISRVYHELISGGDSAREAIKELNEESSRIVELRIARGAQLEAAEDNDALTEYTDWSRCLAVGFENQKVFIKVYEAYREVSKKRNELLAQRIDETLKADEIGVLLIREGHQVQFPSDIQVFYVSPPALDEIERWRRDRRARPEGGKPPEQESQPAS